MTNLEKLRAEMPEVFKLMARLYSDAAEATADYHIEVDRLRERAKSDEELEALKRLAYDRLRRVRDPIYAELNAATKRLADILAMMPPEPVIIRGAMQ